MSIITCEICGASRSWTKVGSAGQPPKICDNPACKAIKSRRYYLKWKAAHPAKAKQYQHEQYLRRKKNSKKPYKFSRATPVKKYRCQRCGRKTINRFNCPACLHILSDGCSSEYDNFIFISDDIENIPLTGGL